MLNREQVLSQVGNEFCGFGFLWGNIGKQRPETRDRITLIGERSTIAVSLTFSGVNTFPYEGKGDRVSGG